MADEEHVDILKQGVNLWNKWREVSQDTRPDLRGAKLNALDLRWANLHAADLTEANLEEVDLREADLKTALLNAADLRRSDLQGTNLSQACLVGANLSQSHLNRAQLVKANLYWVELRGADLSGANLSSADLTGATITGAVLYGADLTGADLTGADLVEADLGQAHLRYAHLNGTHLRWANLSKADLTQADLSGADLTQADLSGAYLSRTNWNGTELGYTKFCNVDLSHAQGLETATHWAPSTIGIDTIYKSSGNLPEVFLQGAGVPNNFITFMKSLTGQAFDFYSCFISHSSKDREFVECLYADLQRNGVRCWYAPEDLKIGEPFLLGIDQGIRLHDKLLLVLSENSVGSGWVQHEVLSAMAKEQGKEPWVLFPIRLDDTLMETNVPWANMIRQSRHIGDFTQWKNPDDYRRAFDRLLRDLKGKQQA